MQLDIFRGLAALLMILNHSGFAWLSASDSAASYTGALVFAGGWAPVLFFLRQVWVWATVAGAAVWIEPFLKKQLGYSWLIFF